MEYTEALEWINKIGKSGSKLGLSRTYKLLELLRSTRVSSSAAASRRSRVVSGRAAVSSGAAAVPAARGREGSAVGRMGVRGVVSGTGIPSVRGRVRQVVRSVRGDGVLGPGPAVRR